GVVGRTGRVLLVGDYLVATRLGFLLPQTIELGPPVGLLGKDGDSGRFGRQSVHHVEDGFGQLRRFLERRKQVLQSTLVDAPERERNPEIRRLIFVGDGGRRRVEIAASSAQESE